MNGFSVFVVIALIHQAFLESYVLKLGSPSFKTREQAQHMLQKHLCVPWSGLLIDGLKKDRNDPEIERRVSILTKKWNDPLTDYGRYPWIDALPKDYPDRLIIIHGYLQKAKGVNGGDWPKYRHATYLWMADLKSKGHCLSSLHAVQRNMISNEIHWYGLGKYPFD